MAAVAAYAALVSLMNVLTGYRHPTCPVPFDQSQVQTLLVKVSSLVEFLEDYYDSQTSRTSRGSIQDLERKMIIVANAAEDLIETSYVNRVLKREELDICPDLQNSIQEMDQIIQQSMDVRVKRHKNDNQEERGTKHMALLASHPSDDNFMVGFDEQLNHLMDWIRLHNPSLVIIPIVGMGGIGKTTLASNVYNSPYARQYFDIRAWVTVSQHYVVKNIIVSLLWDIEIGGNDLLDYEDLGDMLYKGLCGRRYLIVLDDVWSIQAWAEIRRFFPEQGNGSRILLTTRIRGVAHGVGGSSTYEMRFLDDDESFNLLSKIVYGPEVLPFELRILGKSIAENCKGLPLAIVVIGGLLKMSPKTLDYWAYFAENLGYIISNENDRQYFEILSLSYSHLPIHLKPCFLHMSAFFEKDEIDVSHLINAWVAEGFLKPTKDKILNVIALEYLKDLMDRNLIMVWKRSLTTKVSKVIMHDLLRELCLREGRSENLFCAMEDDSPKFPQRLEFERRIVYKYSTDEPLVLFPPIPHARSIYLIGTPWISTQLGSVSRLLRVTNIRLSLVLMDSVQLVNIRYLSIIVCPEVKNWLLRSLSLFWNLETLILRASITLGRIKLTLPNKIWEFRNLTHLELDLFVALPDPTSCQTYCVLNNLQIIRDVCGFFCTDEVFKLIPNLKELSVQYVVDEQGIDNDKLLHSFTNLALLCKLEVLSVFFNPVSPEKWALIDLENLTFSPYLRELKLWNTEIQWENMTIVGSLPNLELLDLDNSAFCGDEWTSVDGEFERLKYLFICCCSLTTWNAESSHFPRLEQLKISHTGLNEIPFGIGEIPSLELIELLTGNMSAVYSAKRILDERSSQGDDDLLVQGFYYGSSPEEKALMKMWAEANNNFRLV